jgi:hypothetical protein
MKSGHIWAIPLVAQSVWRGMDGSRQGVAAADAANVALNDRLHPNPLGTSAQLPEPDIREIRGEDPLTALFTECCACEGRGDALG